MSLPDYAIEARGLVKTYAASPKSPAKTALKGVDLVVPRGSIFGLLGPNGAGKSTFINILAGIVRKTEGKVHIWGRDIDVEPRNARAAIGVVPQEVAADVFFTPFESLETQAGLYGVPKSERQSEALLAALGLTDKRNAYVRALSGGMKRRVLVAQALVHKPPVIVLDEPTAGVDVELRQTLWQFIARLNREGHTVLLTTHYLEEAEALCGRIAMLKNGKVVALDSTSTLLKNASSNVLRFKIDEQLPPELASQARVTGRIVQFPAHDAAQIEHYLAAVREAGLVAQDVEIRKADLEDVFLDVMGAAS